MDDLIEIVRPLINCIKIVPWHQSFSLQVEMALSGENRMIKIFKTEQEARQSLMELQKRFKLV